MQRHPIEITFFPCGESNANLKISQYQNLCEKQKSTSSTIPIFVRHEDNRS